MKKNIVFVHPSLDAGGGEKSLINVLHTIDYSLYEVDLILFHKSGLFLQSVPSQVKIIEIPGNYQVFKMGLFSSIFTFLKQLNFKLLFYRLVFAIKNKIIKNKAVAEQNNWHYIAASIPNFSKKYAAAIGFLEKSSSYLVADKITATTKIGWIHTNYSNSGMDKNFDKNYFEKLNYIVAVSAECEADLKQNFNDFSNKIKLIHNIVSPDLILEMAKKTEDDSTLNNKNLLVTVARLSHEKGVDIALEAAKILKENKCSFRWIVIGDGGEKQQLLKKIADYNLSENFILIGLKQNPYPYVAKATIYIQPSRYEGKSIAIDEAKILGRPIIVTNYPSAKDQIENKINGIIVETNAVALANAIQDLLNNETVRDNFTLHLKNEKLGTTKEILKLYDLIDG